MTRKKFVKQLMALGCQRNNAAAVAEYARRGGWTYEQYLKVERQCIDAYTAMQTAATAASARISEAFSSIMPTTGIDLAAGPDMTAYRPNLLQGPVVIKATPNLADMTDPDKLAEKARARLVVVRGPWRWRA